MNVVKKDTLRGTVGEGVVLREEDEVLHVTEAVVAAKVTVAPEVEVDQGVVVQENQRDIPVLEANHQNEKVQLLLAKEKEVTVVQEAEASPAVKVQRSKAVGAPAQRGDEARALPVLKKIKLTTTRVLKITSLQKISR